MCLCTAFKCTSVYVYVRPVYKNIHDIHENIELLLDAETKGKDYAIIMDYFNTIVRLLLLSLQNKDSAATLERKYENLR